MNRTNKEGGLMDYIKEADFTSADILDDREVAKLLFGAKCKTNSWKTIQRMARNNEIRGKLVGRQWRFHREAIRDFLFKK